MKIWQLAAGSALLVLAPLSSHAMAQGIVFAPGTGTAGPDVSPAAATASSRLQAAVIRLARDPRDEDALVAAGQASLDMGDADAARGFYERADQVRPRDTRVEVGLARAYLRQENPFEALRLFDAAVHGGVPVAMIAADRGMAFDLIGDSSRALADYRLASAGGGSDTLVVRTATALALSGRMAEADRLLTPLLNRHVGDAWRVRALYLAAAGREDEAYRITQGFMDAGSAAAMRPYLDRMPRLTRAQQAAAIYFGHFPTSDAVGHDSIQVAQADLAEGVRPADGAAVATNAPPVPSARALRRLAERQRREQEANAARQRKVEAAAAAERARLEKELAARNAAEQAKQAELARQAEQARMAAATVPPVATVNRPTGPDATRIALATPPPAVVPDVAGTVRDGPVATPRVVLPSGYVPSEPAPAPASASASASPAIPAAPAPQPSLSAIVAAIQVPESERERVEPAVDLNAIAREKAAAAARAEREARRKAEAEAKRAADEEAARQRAIEKANPARSWVQIATGAQVKALAFTWRRMQRDNGKLFADRDAWTVPWGRTRRLLVGPFASERAAKSFAAKFKAAGGDGFVWESDKGMVVDKLAEL